MGEGALKVIKVSSARYELLRDMPVLNMYLCKVDTCAKWTHMY